MVCAMVVTIDESIKFLYGKNVEELKAVAESYGVLRARIRLDDGNKLIGRRKGNAAMEWTIE